MNREEDNEENAPQVAVATTQVGSNGKYRMMKLSWIIKENYRAPIVQVGFHLTSLNAPNILAMTGGSQVWIWGVVLLRLLRLC